MAGKFESLGKFDGAGIPGSHSGSLGFSSQSNASKPSDNPGRPRKAVVLAAGFGTRLRPFTCAVPKPLLPVWGEPMLARVVAWLRSQGVDDIVVNCHYLHEQVEKWCEINGCRASFEPEILGTGGVLNPLRDWIGGDDFYLVNGDIVFEHLDQSALECLHCGDGDADSSAQTLIGTCLVSESGPRTIEVEPEENLVTCWHSPDPGWKGTWTYCGVALLSAEILKYVKPEGFSSIIEAYERASMDGKFIRAVQPSDLLWTDAGTTQTYISLNQDGDDNAFADIPQVRECLAALKSGSTSISFEGVRGSDRAFFKVDGDKYIIVYDDEKRGENARYAGHARWLAENGIKVPKVLADLPAMKALVLESAGSEDLRDRSRRRGEDRLYDYVVVVEELARFNGLAVGDLGLEPPFDADLYKWERELFREHCLFGHFHMEMPEAVERELESVAERLGREPPALVHRDFQSSNIIWKNDDFKIIDFQGMRLGPAAYDLASLLYDPYMDLRDGERKGLAALYAKKAGRAEVVDVLPFAAVERLIQALGAFGRLTAAGKAEFAKHIMSALENILQVADAAGLDAVGALAEDLIAKESALAGGHGKDAHHHHDGCECGCHKHGGRE